MILLLPDLVAQHDIDPKHRGFGFVTFSSSADAQDAIDNMDMNELNGKVLKVNLARPATTVALNPQSNKASASSIPLLNKCKL